MNRRNFIQASAGLSVLSIIGFRSIAAAPSKTIGLQLYTLRNEIQSEGIESVLAKVAKLGFKEVENFGYTDGKFFGKTPKEYSQILKDNGLKAVSGHYLTGRSKQVNIPDGLAKNWQKVLDDAAEIGQSYAVIAFLFPDERTSDDYKKLIELLNKENEATKKAGLTLGYHNHDFEFTEKVDGEKPYDLILRNTPVQMEMDLYWVAKANESPVEYFTKYPGRFPLWHVKDMAKTEEKEFAEVGTGSIDFAHIFKNAKKAGLKSYFVEQDVCKRSPFDCIQTSIQNIQKAKWG